MRIDFDFWGSDKTEKPCVKKSPGLRLLKNRAWPCFLPVFFVVVFLLTNCANPIAPTGGPKDETPPQLDTLQSTRNRQIRFEKKDIVLAFDEWVELKDAFNQVVVSPPLEFRPTIARKKKTIQFKFDEREVLRDSATYVINFGEAIRDLTEGNVAPVVFVFSTGDYIDSLSVEGRIIDAYTGEPVKDVLFMLYENVADSVLRTERPFYFSKTDESGQFKVSNIKAGRFKGAALADKNLNYRFDNEAEKVAFLDSTILIDAVKILPPDTLSRPPDSLSNDSLAVAPPVADSLLSDSAKLASTPPVITQSQPPLLLRLFEEEKKLYLRSGETKIYGRVKLAFNREPYNAVVSYDSIGQFTYLEKQKDTLLLWYALETDAPFNVYVKRDTSIDTVEVKSGLQEKFYENAKLEPAAKAPNRLPVLPPGNPFDLTFNHPVFSLNEDLIRLLEDSVKTAVPGRFFIDSLEKKKVRIEAAWKQDSLYEVVFEPGSITDIFGLQNADTIRRKWLTGVEKDFGSLTLRIVNLRPDTAYVVRLLAKNDQVVNTYTIRDTSTFATSIPFIAPDVYQVEIIEDLDRNGRWTTGNYDLKRQPERVQKAKLEEVRANWEVDAEVELDFSNSAARQPASPTAPGSRQAPGGGLRRSGGKQ